MSFLKKLFGSGKEEASAEPIAHEGYQIVPTPIKEGGTFRVCGIISREIDGETKSHKLIRADTLPDIDAANEMTVRKAKQIIKEQGDAIFC